VSTVELFRRRHLPHWDVPGAAYFVTGCLEGSIPAQGVLDIQQYRANLLCVHAPWERAKKNGWWTNGNLCSPEPINGLIRDPGNGTWLIPA
jgi:hypothetical protein